MKENLKALSLEHLYSSLETPDTTDRKWPEDMRRESCYFAVYHESKTDDSELKRTLGNRNCSTLTIMKLAAKEQQKKK